MAVVRSYRDLVVWQKAMLLTEEAYRLAKVMPRSEEYRLTSQLLRAAVSVPANIAEGNARATRRISLVYREVRSANWRRFLNSQSDANLSARNALNRHFHWRTRLAGC